MIKNKCIFRYINTCSRCRMIADENQQYCKVHSNNINLIYNIVNNVFIYNKINCDQKNIYKLFEYIYDNDEIYTKELVFKSCLSTLFTKKNKLLSIYPDIDKTLDINEIIEKIIKLSINTYNILKNHKDKIIKILIFFVNNNIKDKSENIEDPFTFELIEDIPKNKLFKFKQKNHVYAFDILEFKYFIDNYGKWNPYTKEELSELILNKIETFIYINNLNINEIEEKYKQNTIIQCYTTVSQALEKIGFYNNVEWFLKFKLEDIKKIVKSFHYISNDIPEHIYYIRNINTIKDFCNEVIILYENGNSKFLLCCMFIKSLALYSNDFYNNIPEWLTEIISPIRLMQRNDIYYLIHLLEY